VLLNLKKIYKIRQVLKGSALLNFHKCGEEQEVTLELMERYRQGDVNAANIIASAILRHVHGAMKYFGIMEDVPYQEWTDFRDSTAERIWEYSVPRYDPSRAQFSTFVFEMVNNMWKNWLKQKAIKPLDTSISIDEPIGEGGSTGADSLRDPFALDFKSEVEAQIIESALLENVENPRYREILELWLGEDPRMGPKGRAKEVAEKYNKAHPEKLIDAERMYRLVIYEIYPLVLDKFPEMASSVGYMESPEIEPGVRKWVRKPKSEVAPLGETISEEEEQYVPLEERVAPVYRIDPQTCERIFIILNMKRLITSAQEAWCHNLLTFLSIERYGKFRRTIKSSAKR
jgi:hypothetical protein